MKPLQYIILFLCQIYNLIKNVDFLFDKDDDDIEILSTNPENNSSRTESRNIDDR